MSLDRLLIESLLPQDNSMIYHCAWHKVIYKDELNSDVLIDLKSWGFFKGMPLQLTYYNITSGICDECFYFEKKYNLRVD